MVIAIIGVLVALLLPAVQSAREASRRMQCSEQSQADCSGGSQLSRHAQAICRPASTNADLAGSSGFAAILPYLEQAQPVSSNTTSRRATATRSTCRSSRSGSRPTSARPASSSARCRSADCDANDRAPGTYAFSTSTGDPYGVSDGAIVNANTPPTRFASITDGTSNTFLAGENHWGFHDYTFTSGPCTGQVRGGFSYWSSPYPLATVFTHPRAVQSAIDERRQHAAGNFRSSHPAGVNMANVDGSVRFVMESIDHAMLDATATRDGGESLHCRSRGQFKVQVVGHEGFHDVLGTQSSPYGRSFR